MDADSDTMVQVLQADTALWSEAARLKQLTTIEVERDRIMFEQVGLVGNVGQLHLIYDLLNDLGDMLQGHTLRRK